LARDPPRDVPAAERLLALRAVCLADRDVPFAARFPDVLVARFPALVEPRVRLVDARACASFFLAALTPSSIIRTAVPTICPAFSMTFSAVLGVLLVFSAAIPVLLSGLKC
jgi:hypothetical protein